MKFFLALAYCYLATSFINVNGCENCSKFNNNSILSSCFTLSFDQIEFIDDDISLRIDRELLPVSANMLDEDNLYVVDLHIGMSIIVECQRCGERFDVSHTSTCPSEMCSGRMA